MKQQEIEGSSISTLKMCFQIKNVHKVYSSKRGNCCAVNYLQLTLYENQILALLDADRLSISSERGPTKSSSAAADFSAIKSSSMRRATMVVTSLALHSD
ncbi:hypothetical protein Dimus_031524 [Dionaea muscipula]